MRIAHFLGFWSLKIGPKGCPEKSVQNHQPTIHKIPKERRSNSVLRTGPASQHYIWTHCLHLQESTGCEKINTVEPLLSGLMTDCRWQDNLKSRIIEDDPKRPVNAPILYVKIIWWITSYSTSFILKRNTGNWFYVLSYVRLSGIFLEKVRQKTLFSFLAPFQLYWCAELAKC
jgi:hypothetical protein